MSTIRDFITNDELQSLVESHMEIRQSLKELSEAEKQTEKQVKKTSETVNKLSPMYGGVSNSQGKVAEEFFFNMLKHKPVLNGIQFDYIEKNVTRSKVNL